MSHEAKLALERIFSICENARELSSAQMRLFDIAMEGLGFVSGQRREILTQCIQRKRDRIMARCGQAS